MAAGRSTTRPRSGAPPRPKNLVRRAASSTLNPHRVVVGGNLAHGNPVLVDEIRSVALSRIPALTASSTRILEGRISDQSGLYGAAHLALRSVLDPAMVDRAIDQGVRLRVEAAEPVPRSTVGTVRI